MVNSAEVAALAIIIRAAAATPNTWAERNLDVMTSLPW